MTRTLYVPGTDETDLKKIIMSLQQIAGVVAVGIGGRETLTADRTYYVRTDGSNSNNGLTNTASGAFLTIQKAVDTVLTIDLSGFAVTIQLANGTYTSGVLLTSAFNGGNVTISGDTTTPSNVVWNITGTGLFIFGTSTQINIQGVKFICTGAALASFGTAVIFITGNLEFGACGIHMQAGNRGNIITNGITAYTVSGGGTYHFSCAGSSLISLNGVAVTVSGTPAFTQFAYSSNLSYLSLASCSFTGAATGQRFLVDGNAAISVNGAGANFFPGNVAGVPVPGAGAAQWYN